jgi:hypothetical protein
MRTLLERTIAVIAPAVSRTAGAQCTSGSTTDLPDADGFLGDVQRNGFSLNETGDSYGSAGR